ncbi:hypothetical protein D6C99_07920 [Aureobasidium pullulans]|nr:hypothetical protein D6C99_07920 [Aureobasidium pullulans]
MKLSFLLLTIAISGVMMSPTINRRQNDVQKCVKGQGDMKGKAYDGILPSSWSPGAYQRMQRFLAVSRFIVWVVALTTTKIMCCQPGAIMTPSCFPYMR